MAYYDMQHDSLPKGICAEIVKAQRRFVWGETENQRKIHLVNWDTLCQNKKQGGMGFKNLNLMNQAFLLKILWKLITDKNSLWSQVFKAKYGEIDVQFSSLRTSASDSDLWKNLAKVWQVMRQSVEEMDGLGNKFLVWKHEANGEFSVASAYKSLTNQSNTTGDKQWSIIWKWKGTERIKVFFWLLCHGKLLTAQRKHKMMGTSPYCHNCQTTTESILHAIRDCPRAATVWMKLLHPCTIAVFFSVPFEAWISLNLSNNLGMSSCFEWIDEFITACWWIWNWRNKEAHNQDFNRPLNAVGVIRSYITDMRAAFNKSRLANTALKVHLPKNSIWEPPPLGWTKLNTDGLSREGAKEAGCGGLIRTHRGEWVGGFMFKLGFCGAYQTELWGIFHGMQTA